MLTYLENEEWRRGPLNEKRPKLRRIDVEKIYSEMTFTEVGLVVIETCGELENVFLHQVGIPFEHFEVEASAEGQG